MRQFINLKFIQELGAWVDQAKDEIEQDKRAEEVRKLLYTNVSEEEADNIDRLIEEARVLAEKEEFKAVAKDTNIGVTDEQQSQKNNNAENDADDSTKQTTEKPSESIEKKSLTGLDITLVENGILKRPEHERYAADLGRSQKEEFAEEYAKFRKEQKTMSDEAEGTPLFKHSTVKKPDPFEKLNPENIAGLELRAIQNMTDKKANRQARKLAEKALKKISKEQNNKTKSIKELFRK